MILDRGRLTKLVIGIVLVAGAIYVGLGVYHAGGAFVIPPRAQAIRISSGSAEGRRLDGRAWSLKYDHIQTTADGSIAEVDGLHDGVLFRHGKPYVRLRAKHATVNTVTNDITLAGAITITTIDDAPRSFTTDAATWTNFSQHLLLPHESTMRSGNSEVRIASVDINFRSGDVTLGRITGDLHL